MLTVADLRQFVDLYAEPVRKASASQKVLDDLGRVSQVLEPFQGLKLDEFAEFLRTADEYRRTGILPEPGRRARSRATRAPKLSVADAAQRVMALYERATDPTLDYAAIDAEIAALQPLTVPQLKEVAEQVHLSVKGRAKADVLKAMAGSIKERKGTHERTQFRPEPAPVNP